MIYVYYLRVRLVLQRIVAFVLLAGCYYWLSRPVLFKWRDPASACLSCDNTFILWNPLRRHNVERAGAAYLSKHGISTNSIYTGAVYTTRLIYRYDQDSESHLFFKVRPISGNHEFDLPVEVVVNRKTLAVTPIGFNDIP